MMSDITIDDDAIDHLNSTAVNTHPRLPPQDVPGVPAVATWNENSWNEHGALPADAHPESVTDDGPTARQLLRPFWFVGALLMMLDGLTTYIALEFFSEEGAREGNPIGVWAIEHLGVIGMCAAKVLIGVAMMWRLAVTADRGHRIDWLNRGLVLRRRPRWKVQRNAAWTLAFSLVLMGVVVGNNLRAIASLWSR